MGAQRQRPPPCLKLKLHDVSPREQVIDLNAGDLDIALIGDSHTNAASEVVLVYAVTLLPDCFFKSSHPCVSFVPSSDGKSPGISLSFGKRVVLRHRHLPLWIR
jgi:hypothetical protein